MTPLPRLPIIMTHCATKTYLFLSMNLYYFKRGLPPPPQTFGRKKTSTKAPSNLKPLVAKRCKVEEIIRSGRKDTHCDYMLQRDQEDFPAVFALLPLDHSTPLLGTIWLLGTRYYLTKSHLVLCHNETFTNQRKHL